MDAFIAVVVVVVVVVDSCGSLFRYKEVCVNARCLVSDKSKWRAQEKGVATTKMCLQPEDFSVVLFLLAPSPPGNSLFFPQETSSSLHTPPLRCCFRRCSGRSMDSDFSLPEFMDFSLCARMTKVCISIDIDIDYWLSSLPRMIELMYLDRTGI